MANIKITDLVTLTEPVSTDVLPIVDVSLDVTKKISIAQLLRTAGQGSQTAPGISFDGDTNTGVYSPGANQLAFTTNGSEALRIAADGKIGIGITGPEANLSIVGTNTTGGIKIVDSSTSASSPGIEVIAKRGDANNSTSFSAKLLLSRNRTEAAIVEDNQLGSVSFGGNHTDGTEANILYSAALIGVADGDFNNASDMPTALAFYTGSIGWSPDTANANPGSEALRITSGGLVGIGTTDPDELLHIEGEAAKFKGTNTNSINVTSGTEQVFKFGIEGQKSNVYGPVGSIIFRQDGNTWSSTESNFKPTRIEFCTQDSTTTDTSETPRLVVDQSGLVGIGTTNPLAALDINSAASTSPFIASINVAEKARIDSDGRLLVGTSNSRTTGFGIIPKVQIEGVNSVTDAAQSIILNQTDQFGPRFTLAKSRGNTLNSNTIVAEDDELGNIYFCGADGTDISTVGAAITANVDGTPGANNMPGRIVFSTTASGEGTPTERMRITSGGLVGVGTTLPEAHLHIKSTLNTELRLEDQGEYLSLLYNDNGSSISVGVLNADNGNTSVGDTELRIGVDGANRYVTKADGSHTFYQTNGSTESMRITSDGKVGIGATVPTSILNVKSPLFNTAETVASFGNSSISDGLEIITNGNLDWGFNAKNSRNLTFRTNQTERLRITSGGLVGIGTTVDPVEKLEVNGTIKATDINFTGLATYADDAAAGTGGLVTGDVYKTSTGELRIKV